MIFFLTTDSFIMRNYSEHYKKGDNMKKYFVLLLAVITMLSVVFCGGSSDGSDDDKPPVVCEVNDASKDFVIELGKDKSFNSCIENYKSLSFKFNDVGTYKLSFKSTEYEKKCGDDTVSNYDTFLLDASKASGFGNSIYMSDTVNDLLIEVIEPTDATIYFDKIFTNYSSDYTCIGDTFVDGDTTNGTVSIEFQKADIRKGTLRNPEPITLTGYPLTVTGKVNEDSAYVYAANSKDEDKFNTTQFKYYSYAPHENASFTFEVTADPKADIYIDRYFQIYLYLLGADNELIYKKSKSFSGSPTPSEVSINYTIPTEEKDEVFIIALGTPQLSDVQSFTLTIKK